MRPRSSRTKEGHKSKPQFCPICGILELLFDARVHAGIKRIARIRSYRLTQRILYCRSGNKASMSRLQNPFLPIINCYFTVDDSCTVEKFGLNLPYIYYMSQTAHTHIFVLI